MPVAASANEYESYAPMKGDGCGPACEPLTNTARMYEYVQMFFDVLLDPSTTSATGGLFCLNTSSSAGFMGVFAAQWAVELSYPTLPWFSNDFTPAAATPEVLKVVATNMPLLFDGKTTCTKQSGDAGAGCGGLEGRPHGCACAHDRECATLYCDPLNDSCDNDPETWIDSAPPAWRRLHGDPRQTSLMRRLREARGRRRGRAS